MLLPHAHMPCADLTREFRKPYEPDLKKCHDNGIWAPLRDVFGRVTKNRFHIFEIFVKMTSGGITIYKILVFLDRSLGNVKIIGKI